jgi:hypothetical protein
MNFLDSARLVASSVRRGEESFDGSSENTAVDLCRHRAGLGEIEGDPVLLGEAEEYRSQRVVGGCSHVDTVDRQLVKRIVGGPLLGRAEQDPPVGGEHAVRTFGTGKVERSAQCEATPVRVYGVERE